jgi:hypothetical protein
LDLRGRKEWEAGKSEEFHNFYSLPNNIRAIKSRMRWVGHVTCMAEMKNANKILVRKPKGRNHLKDLHIDGRIIPERILEKQGGKV